MRKTCTNCGAASPDAAARFCQECGATLASADGLGKTMVYATSTGSLPNSVDTRSILQRVQKTYGGHLDPATFAATNTRQLDQREHTVLDTDVSGSMEESCDGSVTKHEAAIRACCNLVTNKAQLDPDDEVGLVTFDHQARIEFDICPLRSHKTDLIRTLQSLEILGGTDLNEGLLKAEALFNWTQRDVVRRIVMLTDGHGGEPLQTAQRLKSKGVVIDVIGVGNTPSSVNEELLKQIASTIQGELHYRFIRNHQSLIAHYTQLAHKTKTGT